MKLEITHSYDIWKSLDPKNINDAWEKSKLADNKWISVESLLELSPKELLDEVRKLHIKDFLQKDILIRKMTEENLDFGFEATEVFIEAVSEMPFYVRWASMGYIALFPKNALKQLKKYEGKEE